jgi:hypothetical protein
MVVNPIKTFNRLKEEDFFYPAKLGFFYSA